MKPKSKKTLYLVHRFMDQIETFEVLHETDRSYTVETEGGTRLRFDKNSTRDMRDIFESRTEALKLLKNRSRERMKEKIKSWKGTIAQARKEIAKLERALAKG